MPTYNGCLGPSGLTREEIAAIARDVYLTGMLGRFGLDRAAAEEHFGPEMQLVEMRCAACPETRRCRRFLVGAAGAEYPAAFCPNAPLFAELGRRGFAA